jgi:hypothetical protein
MSCCAVATGLAARADAPKVPQPVDFLVMIGTSVEAAFKDSPGKFEGHAPGRCVHDEKAKPYEWVVQSEFGEGAGHVMVVLNAPKTSGSTDEISLMVTTGAGVAMIGTMKGSPPMGKGRLTVTRSGKGAHLAVTGVGADGGKINVKIDCESTTAE